MISDFCEILKEAKCCSVNMAAKWVNEANHGNEDQELFFNYLALNSYIRALCRYDNSPKVKALTYDSLVYGQEVLSDGNNLLILNSAIADECVDPDSVNCLTEDQICKIIEKIKFLCSTCNCNC